MKRTKELLKKLTFGGNCALFPIMFICFLICGSLMAKQENLALMDKDPEQKMLQKVMGENYDNLSAERMDTGWGYLGRDGKVAIPGYFEDAQDFTFGLGAVKFGGKWGYIDRNLEVVVEPAFDDCKAFSEDLAPVCKENKWGYIGRHGKLKIPYKFVMADRFHEGLAGVTETGKENSFGFIDSEGKYRIKPGEFDFVRKFTEGLASVKNEGKWGYIDKTGKLVIPYKYDDALHFSQDLAAILIDGKWGYIDKTDKEVIPAAYEYAGLFTPNGALVYQDGNSFIINAQGKNIKTANDADDPIKYVNIGCKWRKLGFTETSLTLVNYTKFVIKPFSLGEGLNNLSDISLNSACAIQFNVSASSPENIKGVVSFNADDQKPLCLITISPFQNGNEWYSKCSLTNLIEPKKNVPAGDIRDWSSKTVYYQDYHSRNQTLIFDIDNYVWVLVSDYYETGLYHIFTATLFLIDKDLYPSWEYMVGIK